MPVMTNTGIWRRMRTLLLRVRPLIVTWSTHLQCRGDPGVHASRDRRPAVQENILRRSTSFADADIEELIFVIRGEMHGRCVRRSAGHQCRNNTDSVRLEKSACVLSGCVRVALIHDREAIGIDELRRGRGTAIGGARCRGQPGELLASIAGPGCVLAHLATSCLSGPARPDRDRRYRRPLTCQRAILRRVRRLQPCDGRGEHAIAQLV